MASIKIKSIGPILFSGLLLISSCSKNNNASILPGSTPTSTPIQYASGVTKAIIDTAVGYSNDIYLWYRQLPATMNAVPFASLDSVMNYIKNYSKDTVLPSGVVRNVDKWSFAIKQADWDNISQGIAGDFGLGIFFMSASDLRVKSVEKLSPAAAAGIHRGWQITAIQGVSAINTTDASIQQIVAAIFSSATATITFKKPDGSSQQLTLNAATYQEQPIYADTIYNQPAGKVGYLVYNSFLGDSASVVNNLAAAFAGFSNAGISNLILDLRYNSGGYVWMEQLMANYLINNSGNGQVMNREVFNDKYTKYNTLDRFSKKGNLNLSTLYVIVSKGTASASELLINSLKPFMNIKLVGPSATTGKAVGFFNIPVGSWYIFPVSFKSINALGQGNYYDGFSPDANAAVADGLDKDWGDVTESCLAKALQGINNNGTFSVATVPILASKDIGISMGSGPVLVNDRLINPRNISGAIETRRHFQR
ncbi:MAG: hypothetical protein J7539_03595 [Niabella sp.]|nr:hypothetical protein [Niabella sp.]